MNKAGFVYLITNKVNGKLYVGVTTHTIHKRWLGHKEEAAGGDPRPLYASIRKHGVHSFTHTELGKAETLSDLFQMERHFIALYKSNVRGIGYNLTDGGEGSPGWKHTEANKEVFRRKSLEYWSKPESREKASRLKQISCNAPVYREKIAAIRKVSNTTPEAKLNNSNAQRSPEVVAKKSQATKAQWQDEGFRILKSAQAKAQWSDPDRKAAHIAAYNSPEAKRKKSEANLALWGNPEYKAARLIKMKATRERNKLLREQAA